MSSWHGGAGVRFFYAWKHTIDFITDDSGTGDLRQAMTHAGPALIDSHMQIHGQWQTTLQYTYTAASFLPLSLAAPMLGTNGQFQFTVSGVTPGRTNVVQSSLNLSNWTTISTNVAVSNSLQIIDPAATDFNLC